MPNGEYRIPDRVPKEKDATKRQVNTLLQWCPWFDRTFLEGLGRKQAKALLAQVKDYYRKARGYGIPVAKACEGQAEEWQVQETLKLDPGFDPSFLRELGSFQIESVLSQAKAILQNRWKATGTVPNKAKDSSIIGDLYSGLTGVLLSSFKLIGTVALGLFWGALILHGAAILCLCDND